MTAVARLVGDLGPRLPPPWTSARIQGYWLRHEISSTQHRLKVPLRILKWFGLFVQLLESSGTLTAHILYCWGFELKSDGPGRHHALTVDYGRRCTVESAVDAHSCNRATSSWPRGCAPTTEPRLVPGVELPYREQRPRLVLYRYGARRPSAVLRWSGVK